MRVCVEVEQDEAHRLLERRSLPYRRALSLIQVLVERGKETISWKELELYIKGHIGSSRTTVRSYLELMRQFELIEPDRWKLNVYRVNPEKCFFPTKVVTQKKQAKEAKRELHSDSKPKIRPTQRVADPLQALELRDSKTLVYLEDRGVKRCCSFKGYKDTWKRYINRIKSLGLDVCYVQDAWINAFLVATDEGRQLVSVPAHLGLSTLVVNLILPYVVQKPRRRRKTISYEEGVLDDTHK